MSGIDLSGRWTGLFNYPFARPPVAFEAELRESAGRISGTTSEIGDTPESHGRTLHAVIDGQRNGSSVSFVKLYEEADEEYDSVHYSGSVAAGGDEISGRWEIAGVWSGTFLMVRAAASEEEQERMAAEPVSNGVWPSDWRA